MKITRKDIRELVYKELLNSVDENSIIVNNVSNEPLLNFNNKIEENFDLIEDKNLLKESESKIEELKNITKEISRMKQLIDFRSPLLSNDNL